MNWLVIVQIVIAIIKLIIGGSFSKSEQVALLAKLRAAKKKAIETGDTSDLETLKRSLLS